MIVLHPNTEQYTKLNGYQKNASKLEFVTDGAGKLIVGTEVLNDPNFIEIHEELKKLNKVTYTPNAQ